MRYLVLTTISLLGFQSAMSAPVEFNSVDVNSKSSSSINISVEELNQITPANSIKVKEELLNRQKLERSLRDTRKEFRSGGAGNGGDAIVCQEREIKAMLLDSYEARVKRGLTLDLSNKNIEKQTWRSMVNVAVKRLERVDIHTASILYDYAMEMVNDFEKFKMYPGSRGKNVYLGSDVNTRINDSEHISTPADCDPEPLQMVIQIQPQFRLDLRYHFNKTLWDLLTLEDQAMTILHEAWYRIMIENGAITSTATRYMNGLIASKEFEEYTFSEYLQELKETELREYIIINRSEAVKDQEIKIDLQNHLFTFNQNEVCAPNFKVNMSIKEAFTVFNRSQRYLKNIKFKQVCFENSTLTRLVLPEKATTSKVALRLPFYQAYFDGAISETPTISFHPNGKMSKVSGVKISEFMEMYYICDGEVSYTQSQNCEKGPFIDHDTKVKGLTEINFDAAERPTKYFSR
ncbi:MAG: hypothetical protein ACJAS4_002398 [Bacteriovoracaceae bacterium]|jgi:hypothetical protein